MLLQEAYETHYGIESHEDPAKPLSLVAMNAKERLGTHAGFYNLAARFKLHDMHKHFGMSFVEFIELPRDYCEDLFKVVAEASVQENAKLQAELNKLSEGNK